MLAVALERDQQDFLGAVEGIRQGHKNMKAGDAPAAEMFKELREKHDFLR